MTPLHPQEVERLQALYSLGILDSLPDPLFDAITQQVVEKLHVPISTISLIDKDREWFKSCQGLSTTQGPREVAFCSWALLCPEIFIIEDTTLDDRFKNNPYVIGPPFIRFYAGCALHDLSTHLPIGVLCAKDTRPRTMSLGEMDVLISLSKQAEALLNKKD